MYFRSLLTSEDLYAIFSHNLNPTNIYLELEILEKENKGFVTCKDTEIFPKDYSPLPASCKDIHIHLIHKQSPTIDHKQLKCCKELQVFEDLISLNLNSNNGQKDDANTNKNDKSLEDTIAAWWEAEIVIRGFKDQPTKGFNIWS